MVALVKCFHIYIWSFLCYIYLVIICGESGVFVHSFSLCLKKEKEKMKEFFKSIIKTIKNNIYVGERYEKNLHAIAIEAVIVFFIGVIMGTINLYNHEYLSSISSFAFVLASPICYYVVKFKKMRTLAIIITMMTILVVFTFDVFFVTNGFTYLWIMLVPLGVSYLFGIKEGFVASVYFETLFIVAFYTPIKDMLGDNYQTIITNRFPILYFFHCLTTLFVIYQYHKSVQFEIEYEKRLNSEVVKQTKKALERAAHLEKLSKDVVSAFAKTIDAKDKYTNGHSLRVSMYAIKLGEAIGYNEDQLKDLEMEGLLHDIGKIGVPDVVLNKPGKLNVEELKLVRAHTVIGKKIIDEIDESKHVSAVAMYHHERYDGTGYPEGLKGENIPFNARIVAIADAYDAMYSKRIYRDALTKENIILEFERCKGTQFDPKLAEVFIKMIKNNEL